MQGTDVLNHLVMHANQLKTCALVWEAVRHIMLARATLMNTAQPLDIGALTKGRSKRRAGARRVSWATARGKTSNQLCQRWFQLLLAQEVSHTLTDRLQSAGQALCFTRICAGIFDASLSRTPRGAGPCFRIPFCNNSAASSAGSSGSVTGSGRIRCASTPLFHRSSCTASPFSAARAPPAALGSSSPREVFSVATCSGANPFVAETPPTCARTGDRAVRLSLMAPAAS